MITVDLDQDSYDLIRRAIFRRIERGAATTVTEREWAVIQAARQVGREQRLSMGPQEAESLCDWFEKTFDIVGALGDRWPNAGDVLDAAREREPSEPPSHSHAMITAQYGQGHASLARLR